MGLAGAYRLAWPYAATLAGLGIGWAVGWWLRPHLVANLDARLKASRKGEAAQATLEVERDRAKALEAKVASLERALAQAIERGRR